MSEDEGRVEVGVGGVGLSKVRSVVREHGLSESWRSFSHASLAHYTKRTACSGTSPKAFTLLVPTYTIEDA